MLRLHSRLLTRYLTWIVYWHHGSGARHGILVVFTIPREKNVDENKIRVVACNPTQHRSRSR